MQFHFRAWANLEETFKLRPKDGQDKASGTSIHWQPWRLGVGSEAEGRRARKWHGQELTCLSRDFCRARNLRLGFRDIVVSEHSF